MRHKPAQSTLNAAIAALLALTTFGGCATSNPTLFRQARQPGADQTGPVRVDIDVGDDGHIDRTIEMRYGARGELLWSEMRWGESFQRSTIDWDRNTGTRTITLDVHTVTQTPSPHPRERGLVRSVQTMQRVDRYNARGLMVSQCLLLSDQPEVCTAFEYDALDRLARQASTPSNVQATHFLYETDAAGRVNRQLSFYEGQVPRTAHTLRYDDEGRLIEIKMGDGPEDSPLVAITTFEYGTAGKLSVRRFKTAVGERVLRYTYRWDGRLESVEGDMGVSSDCFDTPWQPKGQGACFALGQGVGSASMVYLD